MLNFNSFNSTIASLVSNLSKVDQLRAIKSRATADIATVQNFCEDYFPHVKEVHNLLIVPATIAAYRFAKPRAIKLAIGTEKLARKAYSVATSEQAIEIYKGIGVTALTLAMATVIAGKRTRRHFFPKHAALLSPSVIAEMEPAPVAPKAPQSPLKATEKPLESLSTRELRKAAQAASIVGRSKMNRQQLIAALVKSAQ